MGNNPALRIAEKVLNGNDHPTLPRRPQLSSTPSTTALFDVVNLKVGARVKAKLKDRFLLGEIKKIDQDGQKYFIRFVDREEQIEMHPDDIIGIISDERFERAQSDQYLIDEFIEGAGKDNIALVKKIITTLPHLINGQNKDGRTALMAACKGGNMKCVKALLNTTVKREIRDDSGYTALMWASYKGYTDVMQALIAAGADKEARGYDGGTALMYATLAGKVTAMKTLIDAGAKIETKTHVGWTPLLTACKKCGPDAIHLLLQSGANVDVKTDDGKTCLMLVENIDVLKILLQHRANINATDKVGRSILINSCISSKLEIIETFLNVAAININFRDPAGDVTLLPRPILESAHPHDLNENKFTVVQIPGATSYKIAFHARSALYADYYDRKMNWSFVRFLKGDSRVEYWGEERYTGGHGDLRPKDKNFPGIDGNPPLIIPDSRFVLHFHTSSSINSQAWGYQVSITPVLESGWTALMWAAYRGRTSVVMRLLQVKNIQLDIQAWDGRTAVALAIDADHEDTSIALMRAGARLDLPDKDGITPIEKAIKKELHIFLTMTLTYFTPFIGDTADFAPGAAFAWIEIIRGTKDYEVEVDGVLVRNKERIHALVEVEDRRGRKAFHIAKGSYKSAFIDRLDTTYVIEKFDANSDADLMDSLMETESSKSMTRESRLSQREAMREKRLSNLTMESREEKSEDMDDDRNITDDNPSYSESTYPNSDLSFLTSPLSPLYNKKMTDLADTRASRASVLSTTSWKNSNTVAVISLYDGNMDGVTALRGDESHSNMQLEDYNNLNDNDNENDDELRDSIAQQLPLNMRKSILSHRSNKYQKEDKEFYNSKGGSSSPKTGSWMIEPKARTSTLSTPVYKVPELKRMLSTGASGELFADGKGFGRINDEYRGEDTKTTLMSI